MDNEIQLISDGDGLAVIGESKAVERFLASVGLPSKDLGLPRLKKVVGAGAAGMQAGSEIAANSGRWVQLTRESAEAIKKFGLIKSKTDDLSYAMVGKPGNIKEWIKIAKGPGSLAANPAVLSGAAGIMTQLAMQQAMDEITDYLAKIDEKLDDVLRAQKDAVLADMMGVDLVIEEAMTVREHVGRVSEVTWSKVQATSMMIARTQAYALRQLDALTDKVERKAKISDLADAAEDAGAKVHEWLAVLARCFQLQDAMAVLELDRVLDAVPEELDRHRTATRAARQQRMDLIARSTGRLMARLDEAASTANTKVLLHPAKAPVVVRSSNEVATAVLELDERLGIDRDRDAVSTRRWVDAAADVRDKALETGAGHVDAAKRRGNETFDRARSVKGKFSDRVGGRVRLRRDGGEDEREEEV
jgi:hypothetical protein